jgi:REP element-mobilizing transposase RayT
MGQCHNQSELLSVRSNPLRPNAFMELGFVNQKIIWQRNYYEHVIRDGEDYQRVFNYIETNPGNWEHDSEYASN